jgi:hypothetical protein
MVARVEALAKKCIAPTANSIDNVADGPHHKLRLLAVDVVTAVRVLVMARTRYEYREPAANLAAHAPSRTQSQRVHRPAVGCSRARRHCSGLGHAPFRGRAALAGDENDRGGNPSRGIRCTSWV